MENIGIQEIHFEVRLNRVGIKEIFFGAIGIQDKSFEFNFSQNHPVTQNDNCDYRLTKETFRSINMDLFNEKGEEIDLEFEEFAIFYSVVFISVEALKSSPIFTSKLHGFISLHLTRKKIKILNQPKFNCGINPTWIFLKKDFHYV